MEPVDVATNGLMKAVKDKKMRQKDIVPLYAEMQRTFLSSGRNAFCMEVNTAIIARWSPGGLGRIKNKAVLLLEES